MNLGRSDWKALAIRWSQMTEEQQASLTKRMSRQELRRFQRLLEDVEAKKLHDAESFVTKRQLVQYFEVHINHQHMPLAANLDEVTRVVQFLALPFYKRWWVTLKVWGDNIRAALVWLGRFTILQLDRLGIRFIQLPTGDDAQEDDDGDGTVPPDSGALGGEPEGADGSRAEVREPDAEPGVPGDGLEPVGNAHTGPEAGADSDPGAAGEAEGDEEPEGELLESGVRYVDRRGER